MTKKPRVYNEERTVSSIKVLGKLNSHMQKNENGPLSLHYMQKLIQNELKI